ncbi:hypothetical protein QBC44DRAFT_329380 [Cladorrhinum sp. PSN332]|nr:hypothetical protein QBC44DRAFT_329380 [Cladorrhinum sp. PSN332]
MAGETERTKTGQYTGIAGLELTPAGSKRVQDTATQLVGAGKLIDPARVAHGLILRAFVKRWLGCPFDMPLPMMLPPGGIGILRYRL